MTDASLPKTGQVYRVLTADLAWRGPHRQERVLYQRLDHDVGANSALAPSTS
jgi:hypothetical protein